ncbi:MAG: amidohydrolase family protein, partial [Verrucomicrobiota bacterium]
SAFYALGKKEPPYTDLIPMFRRVRDAFGADRLMWGSDAPFQLLEPHTYGASLELVTGMIDFLSESEKKQILRGTAERVFFS